MRKTFGLIGAALLLVLSLGPSVPASASVDAPATAESVQRPTHNETTLSLFTCAAIRGSTGHGTMTINHSHRIASESTVDAFGQPAIDAFDCEGYVNPGLDGCVYRGYYVYDNKADGTDLGILPSAVRVNCFGF
jgi:hypothetical protein